jgi:DNA-binding Lrp family transcriptional regulator
MLPPKPLAEIDRRIIGCLQAEGRASWRQVAEVLGEPERTVARRGSRLLETGTVVVSGLAARGESVLVRADCAAGTARITARGIAARPDTTFSYLVTGVADCVAEMIAPPNRQAELLLDELPATPGLTGCTSLPILRYYRTVPEWQPDLVGTDELARLQVERPAQLAPVLSERIGTDSVERRLVDALRRDGRCTNEELARIAGVSESTARRRVEYLRRHGLVVLRTIVEPALIGRPVEALLWIRAAPQHVDAIGESVAASPDVRYCAAVMGTHQLVVDVAVADKAALHAFITRGDWQQDVIAVESSLVVSALKRGGVLTGSEDRS